ncbi:MAG: hypothetical protein UMU04_02450 [Halanaerobiales bacterium]|nr:hypothetical protein [Halanaerobiales bacterium]
MSRKSFVVGLVLILVIIFSSGVSAQLLNFYGLDNMLMSDWQLDYIRPLDPGELKKGEFRLSPLIGRINSGREREIFDSTSDEYDYENGINAYFLVFDTALSDNLTFHSKYVYQPWEKYTYNDYMDSEESRSSLIDLFINYEFKEDKTMFFGYNRTLNKDKEYDDLDNLEYETETTNNIYYLGFEIRGSFLN